MICCRPHVGGGHADDPTLLGSNHHFRVWAMPDLGQVSRRMFPT